MLYAIILPMNKSLYFRSFDIFGEKKNTFTYFFNVVFQLPDFWMPDLHYLSKKQHVKEIHTLYHAFSLQKLYATNRNRSVLSKRVPALEIKCKINP